ncbi:hybrid sensor histidine kinase/response regulator [Massilia arenosa]|uniref:histidine kinase n=1 Tax=Zemynaea arenosa TaxID=2561931 RepID=A0A4Y9SHX3_9BURK|nr:ATP-binding protein [Massilia arenosa]TFW24690.1 hybrid sensor histidine kinase/response regulator [Massilia arenosa]
MEHRILIHTPTGKDGRLIATVLARNGMQGVECTTPSQLLDEMGRGVGALILAEEVLAREFTQRLSQYVEQQDTWSDLPVIVLTRRDPNAEHLRSYPQLGNVTLLERPVNSVTLSSAAQAALRARRRQYDMRDIDRRKDEFLAMLAHELRNPLAPISAAADILRLAAADPARVRQTSEIVSRQVKHMTALIDDLLDVSRVSRGLVELAMADVDARGLLTHAVEQVRPLIERRRHRLTVTSWPEPALVRADAKRLIQIVANLLNNAAKYTPEGGSITLALSADDSQVALTVEDNGIGIPARLMPHVFELFSQAERSPDRSQGGLGIGLALVRSLVKLHGGSAEVESAGEGQGSRFTVRLPRLVSRAHSEQAAASALTLPPGQHRKLLVVDDNVDAAQTLSMFLEAAGHDVTVEYSASAALRVAHERDFDACLLDIGLPDLEGTELVKRLRVLPRLADATFIAVTGYGQEQDRKRTREAGFQHHFVKPVDLARLMQVLAAGTTPAT